MFKEVLLFVWETIWFDNIYYDGPTEIVIDKNEIYIRENPKPIVEASRHPVVKNEIIIIDRIDSILNVPYELHFGNNY